MIMRHATHATNQTIAERYGIGVLVTTCSIFIQDLLAHSCACPPDLFLKLHPAIKDLPMTAVQHLTNAYMVSLAS